MSNTYEWRELLRKIEGRIRLDDTGMSFGYIGNCDPYGTQDDRMWTVWSGRRDAFGKSITLCPYFSTGNVDGARRALDAIAFEQTMRVDSEDFEDSEILGTS